MKVTEAIKSDLKKTLTMLPSGSQNRISITTGYSQSYISKFFNGQYEITHDNEKIIDAAITILQEDIDRENRLKNKLQLVIN